MKLRSQKGVAAVELALIMVPMLVLCFGIVEVGRALYYYNGLVKATRGAARYLTTKNLNDITTGVGLAAVGTAKNLAVCGQLSCTSTDPILVPGLDVSKVTVTTNNDVLTGVGSVSLVTVRIGPDEPAKPNDAKAVWFESFLPYSITRFKFSSVKITMAWSVT